MRRDRVSDRRRVSEFRNLTRVIANPNDPSVVNREVDRPEDRHLSFSLYSRGVAGRLCFPKHDRPCGGGLSFQGD
jgi:hypothetical protein